MTLSPERTSVHEMCVELGACTEFRGTRHHGKLTPGWPFRTGPEETRSSPAVHIMEEYRGLKQQEPRLHEPRNNIGVKSDVDEAPHLPAPISPFLYTSEGSKA
jgi:hypothetical protein